MGKRAILPTKKMRLRTLFFNFFDFGTSIDIWITNKILKSQNVYHPGRGWDQLSIANLLVSVLLIKMFQNGRNKVDTLKKT